jgi:hypothetical protein
MHGFAPVAQKCQECHPGHAVGMEGMQALHCFACHDFLADQGGLRPTRRDCMRCHTAQGIHAPMTPHGAPGAGMSCSGCHRPHRPKGQTLAACGECHTPDRMRQGGLHAIGGHAACLECHRPHTWKSAPEDCRRCHRLDPVHAGKRACSDCHDFTGAPLPSGDRP